jgi:hypothetical protein
MAQTKQQRERILLVALLAMAGLVWYFYFGKKHAGTGVVTSANYTPINAVDYGLVFEKLKIAQGTEYKSSGRNIFIAGPAPVVPAPGAPAPVKPVKPSSLPKGPFPPPAPNPPQLSMTFFGYGTLPSNGSRRAFLLDGDEVRIVSEGDTIQNHIRITHIGNDRIEFEDTVTGLKNTKNMEAPPAV